MIDPISAMALASGAFNLLKRGIEMGKEIEDMGGQLERGSALLLILEKQKKKAKTRHCFVEFYLQIR